MTATTAKLLPHQPRTIHDDRWGGPHTCLPRPLESFLSWSLAVSCLAVSGYHYIKGRLFFPKTQPTRLPLMVVSRDEVLRSSPEERYHQFQTLLRKVAGSFFCDKTLIDCLQTNHTLRRLATLCVAVHDPQLERIWETLLLHETKDDLIPKPNTYDIAVIVPCYREDPQKVSSNLRLLLDRSHTPSNIQVVLVVAESNNNTGQLSNNHSQNYTLPNGFGRTDIVHCPNAGRGPALNAGAEIAHAPVLVFLHSDTLLPYHWDVSVLQSLQTNDACCFRFGIAGGCHVPGIRAVETTANWRCRLWKLPYGDQCLCVRASLFFNLGGFPHQCIMEDYEFISLLRQREFGGYGTMEILPDVALCSPRRWQTYGVLHVTYTNSRLVNLYASGASAQTIYELYYGQPLSAGDDKSPWEVELDALLRDEKNK